MNGQADKKKILIVDDEADILEVMSVLVASWGYEVIPASSGKEALEAFEIRKPDIAILDYQIPDMDGISILKEIRKTNAKIPVIMFTAHPDAIPIKGADALNISAFVPKMSSEETLKIAVSTALTRLEPQERR